MSKIKTGQVWKNHLGAEMTIASPGYLTLSVLSDDIWIAERQDTVLGGSQYAVTEQSLTDCGYVLDKEAHGYVDPYSIEEEA